jgi:Holliday junction resolvasome RuvABC ATP-dependent DNA helicase subunit
MVIPTANKDFKMLTLRDINAATNSRDGDLYSDLHKDVYGFRPRDVTFASTEEFDADFDRLAKKLEKQIEEEAAVQAANFLKFTARVAATMYLVENATRERAIEIIAEAEGIRKDQFDFYGLEILENELNLKYGSIIKWLSE